MLIQDGMHANKSNPYINIIVNLFIWYFAIVSTVLMEKNGYPKLSSFHK